MRVHPLQKMIRLFFTCAVLLSLNMNLHAQVTMSSYINSANEKVLQHQLVLPVSLQQAWDYCTKDSLMQKWVAPHVHMELKAGGYRSAKYSEDMQGADSNAIILPLICFLDKELMVFKINLNNNFPESVRNTDKNLYFIFQFKSIDETHTAITGSMLGWGTGTGWDKTYAFFEKGNEWEFEQLLKNFDKK